MAQPTIPCSYCDKRHRAAGFEEQEARCKGRLERAQERAAKAKAEKDRRIAVAKNEPPQNFIARLRREGRAWEGASSIVAALKRDYPPPSAFDFPRVEITRCDVTAKGEVRYRVDDEWTLADVMYLDSQRFNWGTAA